MEIWSQRGSGCRRSNWTNSLSQILTRNQRSLQNALSKPRSAAITTHKSMWRRIIKTGGPRNKKNKRLGKMPTIHRNCGGRKSPNMINRWKSSTKLATFSHSDGWSKSLAERAFIILVCMIFRLSRIIKNLGKPISHQIWTSPGLSRRRKIRQPSCYS